MHCPACGTTVRSQARFCSTCGATITAATPVTPSSFGPAGQPAAPQPSAPAYSAPVTVLAAPAANGQGGGLSGKVKGFWQNSYTRSSGFFGRIIPAPQVSRRANPYLAAGLELLGYVGILGAGRIYAGDTKGGVTALVTWFITVLGAMAAISVGGGIALLAAIPTLGVSLLLFVMGIMPLAIPFFMVPAGAAIKLFVVLQRMQP